LLSGYDVQEKTVHGRTLQELQDQERLEQQQDPTRHDQNPERRILMVEDVPITRIENPDASARQGFYQEDG
jgi:hypothetical protein